MLPSFLAMTVVITTDILKFPSLQIIPNIYKEGIIQKIIVVTAA